jgi:putative tryptophan/tyrosine transport system substrate-binding protein
MRRREFLKSIGGTAIAWPLAARAQQARHAARVGWVDFDFEDEPSVRARVEVFQRGMGKLGWTLGRNLTIDYRWGIFDIDKARSAAVELLQLAPDVILCASTPATLAFRQATTTVPIVFAIVNEPVTQGIVQSLAHPGGNITGFAYMEPTIGPKWVELLREIAPHVTRIAFMFNPDANPQSRLFYQSIEAAAPKFAVQAVMVPVRMRGDVEQAIPAMAHEPGGGLIVAADAFNHTNRKLIIELAARHRLPAIYGLLTTATEGGLIYYGVDVIDQFRSAAGYVDRSSRARNPPTCPCRRRPNFR